jgi:hypothetical protein
VSLRMPLRRPCPPGNYLLASVSQTSHLGKCSAIAERASWLRSLSLCLHTQCLSISYTLYNSCWDFATNGLIAYQYRQYGISQGWLQPDQYVAFSEQAYGINVLAACRQNPTLCAQIGWGPVRLVCVCVCVRACVRVSNIHSFDVLAANGLYELDRGRLC